MQYFCPVKRHLTFRRDGRVVDYNGLENRRTERYRGFESLSLRQPAKGSQHTRDFLLRLL